MATATSTARPPIYEVDSSGKMMLMSSRTLQWTSTQIPATSVSKAMLEHVDPVPILNNGILVRKITTRGKLKQRVLTLSKDRIALFCTHQPVKSKQQDDTSTSAKKAAGVLSNVASKLPLPVVTRKGILGLTTDLRSRYVRYIDVADIDYVCRGTVSTRKLENTRKKPKARLRGANGLIDEQRAQIVTIGHHGDQTMDILVKDEQERRKLIDCIRKMQRVYKVASKWVSHDALLLRYIWYDVDVNADGKINQEEFLKIMSRINFVVKNPGKVYRDFCEQRNLPHKDGIPLDEVIALLQHIKNQEGNGSMSMANALWKELFGSNVDVVGVSDFLTKFVHGKQNETSKTEADVRKLFETINDMEINHKEGEPDGILVDQQLSRARFEVYLYHELNDAYDLSSDRLDEGLNLPLARYFVNTSHNTYLTGDQLQSASSVEMYSKALRRGCKCLELDCWDGEVPKPGSGSSTGDGNLHPVVYHGYTITSKILFADILNVVKSYLDDHPDTYPIILSLENHCSHPFQRVMAKALEDTFGKLLHVPRETRAGDLPSPESLRGKIVIKGKRPPEPEEEAPVVGGVESNDDDQYEVAMTSNKEESTKAASGAPENKGDPNAKPEVKPPKIVKELARLTLFHGTKWKSFEKSIEQPESHMHSIGETKITKILNKKPENVQLWRQYNVHHLTRTYPSGARVDSSNYNPLVAWSVGSHLVALNFQTNDAPLILNDGLFRQNRGCGYIAKPDSVVVDDTGGEAPIPSASSTKALLKIRVLSGSCLPKPKGAKTGETIDPYVKVTVHDVGADPSGKETSSHPITHISNSHSTKSITDNGFCPVWNETEFKEFPVTSPDVAMVQFGLREADLALDDDVAYAAIPIRKLRQGIRSIQLFNRDGTRSGAFGFASLLVEIVLTFAD